MENLSKILIGCAVAIVILFFGLITYRAVFWTFVDNYEFAYSFNGRTGETKALINPDSTYRHGYIRSFPYLNIVHTIDTRPIQICISGGSSGTSTTSSVSSRVLNCKLVQFNPEGYATFISWHGRDDYSHDDLEGILKNYAYDGSGQQYPFLFILKELKNENVIQNNIGKDGIPIIKGDSTSTEK